MSLTTTNNSSLNEVSHYVVTAHAPGSVLLTAKCNFLSPTSSDVIIAKSRRLEIRQLRTSCSTDQENLQSLFPIILSVPINGRITSLLPFSLPTSDTSYLFITTDTLRYAVISYDANIVPYPFVTHASGSIKGEDYNILSRPAESAPLVVMDPLNRCIALHLYDGLLTIISIEQDYQPSSALNPNNVKPTGTGTKATTSTPAYVSSNVLSWSSASKSSAPSTTGPSTATATATVTPSSVLKEPFHTRIEERTVLGITFLHNSDPLAMPQICLLYQDSRGAQHIISHVLDLNKRQLHLYGTHTAPASTEWVKRSRVDGGSSLLIPIQPQIPVFPGASAAAATAAVAAMGSSSSSAQQQQQQAAAGTLSSGAGVLILGQRQITYCSPTITKVIPVPPCLFLSWDYLPPDPNGGMPRFLLGDEFGNLHMLTLMALSSSTSSGSGGAGNERRNNTVVGLQLDTLGSCTLSSALTYLNEGLAFVGSSFGDSQLIQIHEEPISMSGGPATAAGEDGAGAGAGTTASGVGGSGAGAGGADAVVDDVDLLDSTYISVVEEYTNLGPIVDFDLVPTAPGSLNENIANNSNTLVHQSQVVTASGTSKSGCLRLIRNGIGMNEYASVEIPGIQNMWSVRKSFFDKEDAYLVLSFVGQTRVLGVSGPATATPTIPEGEEVDVDENMQSNDDTNSYEEDVGGTLEEVHLPGLEPSASTLYVGNVQVGNKLLQITESEIRLIAFDTGNCIDVWSPATSGDTIDDEDYTSSDHIITVASGNEAGQVVVAIQGGLILYFVVEFDKLVLRFKKIMDREVSCLDLNPFAKGSRNNPSYASSSNVFNKISDDSMEVDDQDDSQGGSGDIDDDLNRSALVAVGLWDDFSVRLLSLEACLGELLEINLSTDEEEDGGGMEDPASANSIRRNRNNMMARSLCLVTLDTASSSSNNTNNAISGVASTTGRSNSVSFTSSPSPGVDMLFVGLGDGTLVSFAVVSIDGKVSVQSKKEVCLGTQRINLIPLRQTEQSGTCVLATGDRPTVIYLAGVGGSTASSATANSNQFNPKLCYSNVNLQAGGGEEGAGVEDGMMDEDSRRSSSGAASGAPQQGIAVNVAEPFYSPLLFDAASMGKQHHSLCVADDSKLRLGVIDDIQKLHVTTCRLGMSPRRIVHCPEGRLFAVGCVESGINQICLGPEEQNMENCIRFLDDTTFDDIERLNLEPYEQILSMVYATLRVHTPTSSDDTSGADSGGMDGGTGSDSKKNPSGVGGGVSGPIYKPFLLCGTAYAFPDEDEATRGRIIVFSCDSNEEQQQQSSANHAVRRVTEAQVRGGVYSLCQFYEGKVLAAVNSKTHICELADDGTGDIKLNFVGLGHHGHILTLCVKSRAGPMPITIEASPAAAAAGSQQDENDTVKAAEATTTPMDIASDNNGGPGGKGNNKKDKRSQDKEEMLAIVGDLMRSISVMQYYPQHETLEEIARDFNTNWTTAVEMLTNDVYLGGENWNNLFVLRRNSRATSEEIRCRLDTIGEFHLGEMVNKFMKGSLVMPQSNASSTSNSNRRSPSLRRAPSLSPRKKGSEGGPGGGATASTGALGVRSNIRRPVITIGSQTLFGTVDGTLGAILGLNQRTAAFFSSLERSMTRVIRPVGDFSHQQFRSFDVDRRVHPSHGFVDGDLVESFLDLDRHTMDLCVHEMNRDGGWDMEGTDASSATRTGPAVAVGGAGVGEAVSRKGVANESANEVDINDTAHSELTVDDVMAMVEEMTMLH